MKYLLGALIVLEITDGALTHFLVRAGLGREGNPFLLPLVGGTTFLILKVVGVLLCALILWDIYQHYPKVAVIATSCFTGVYGAIVLWNVSIFFR